MRAIEKYKDQFDNYVVEFEEEFQREEYKLLKQWCIDNVPGVWDTDFTVGARKVRFLNPQDALMCYIAFVG